MSVDFLITIDSEEFNNYNGVKIRYSNDVIPGAHLTIGSVEILFENNIKEQVISCFKVNDFKAFFKMENADFPFDVFAASFYLLSRYEEYLPHKKDSFGRYAHENSLAFREHFLETPLVNTWVCHLAAIMQRRFPGFTIPQSSYAFIPTYDIDSAWSFKQKGLLRNTGGFLRSPSLNRLKVLLGLQKDPFDAFDWLHNLHGRYKLQPLYFFLVAEKKGAYDKNILPYKNSMWKLVKQHAERYTIGIHPSWQSGDHFPLLKKEKELLEAMSESTIKCSRQHYIRFNLPGGFRRLAEAQITDEYSMGYGSINGFRASVATSFLWYDLEKDECTTLLLHPFCFMDANSFYEQKLTSNEALAELMRYHVTCKKVGGKMITIWHNNFLGTGKEFSGWREVYRKFIETLG